MICIERTSERKVANSGEFSCCAMHQADRIEESRRLLEGGYPMSEKHAAADHDHDEHDHNHEHEHHHEHDEHGHQHDDHDHDYEHGDYGGRGGHGHEHGKVDADLYGNRAGLRAVQISTAGSPLVS